MFNIVDSIAINKALPDCTCRSGDQIQDFIPAVSDALEFGDKFVLLK